MLAPLIAIFILLSILVAAGLMNASDEKYGRKYFRDLELEVQAVRTLIASKCPGNQAAREHLRKAEWYLKQAADYMQQSGGQTLWASVRSHASNGLYEAGLARDLAEADAGSDDSDNSESQTK